MKVSHIISDIAQSVITKGVSKIEVSLDIDTSVKLYTVCDGFDFPDDAHCLRSSAYEYIFQKEFEFVKNGFKVTLDDEIGDIAYAVSAVLFANTKLEDFILKIHTKKGEYEFSVVEAQKELGDVFIGEANVINWVEDRISDKISEII